MPVQSHCINHQCDFLQVLITNSFDLAHLLNYLMGKLNYFSFSCHQIHSFLEERVWLEVLGHFFGVIVFCWEFISCSGWWVEVEHFDFLFDPFYWFNFPPKKEAQKISYLIFLFCLQIKVFTLSIVVLMGMARFFCLAHHQKGFLKIWWITSVIIQEGQGEELSFWLVEVVVHFYLVFWRGVLGLIEGVKFKVFGVNLL